MKKLTLYLGLLLVSSLASAQVVWVRTVMAGLPTCAAGVKGRVFEISDATTESDCSVGGATGNARKMSLCWCVWTAGTSAYEWQAIARGTAGATSPGGSDTQVQYNDGSAFGGDAGLTYNETTNVLTVAGGVAGTIGGSTGGTDNALLLADGPGGATAKASPNIYQDVSNNLVLGDSSGARELWFSTVSTAPLMRRNGTSVKIIGNTGSEVELQVGWIAQQDNTTPSTLQNVRIANNKTIAFSDGTDFNRYIGKGAANSVKLTDALQLALLASAPTCNAGAEGMIYHDTSHALCVCDGTAWTNLIPLSLGDCT